MRIYILYFIIFLLIVLYLSKKTIEKFADTNTDASVTASVTSSKSDTDEADECIDEDNKIVKLPSKKEKYTDKKEVFLIYNKYTYDDANKICKLYNGRLATEADLQKAFNNGANWCNWGWIEGNKIAYPVQEKYWEQVEKVHKGHCGPTAGINKISNVETNKKYSVNCYGVKPRKTKKDISLDYEDISKPTVTDNLENRIKKCMLNKKDKAAKKWAKEQRKSIRIISFNNYKWSISNNA